MVYTCAIHLITLLGIDFTSQDKVKSVFCFFPAIKSPIVIDIKQIQKETFHCGNPLSSDEREILTCFPTAHTFCASQEAKYEAA